MGPFCKCIDIGVERLLCYLFCHLKIFLMHASECDGAAGEVEDELAVAVDADDVAFVVFEGTGEDAELHVVFGELLDGGVETCSGWAFSTFIKGCMMASRMEAGRPWQRSFTKWY